MSEQQQTIKIDALQYRTRKKMKKAAVKHITKEQASVYNQDGTVHTELPAHNVIEFSEFNPVTGKEQTRRVPIDDIKNQLRALRDSREQIDARRKQLDNDQATLDELITDAEAILADAEAATPAAPAEEKRNVRNDGDGRQVQG